LACSWSPWQHGSPLIAEGAGERRLAAGASGIRPLAPVTASSFRALPLGRLRGDPNGLVERNSRPGVVR